MAQISPTKHGASAQAPALPASVGEPALPLPVAAAASEGAPPERADVPAQQGSERPRSNQASHTHRAPLDADSTQPNANKKTRPLQDPRWTDAADALRRSDNLAAERSLTGLGASSDPATRDAARLTLAELWLREGQGARARGVLTGLATSGATPLVRARARELLSP